MNNSNFMQQVYDAWLNEKDEREKRLFKELLDEWKLVLDQAERNIARGG